MFELLFLLFFIAFIIFGTIHIITMFNVSDSIKKADKKTKDK